MVWGNMLPPSLRQWNYIVVDTEVYVIIYMDIKFHHPEDGSRVFLQNISIYPQFSTISEPEDCHMSSTFRESLETSVT
jgi:hypothetical protein